MPRDLYDPNDAADHPVLVVANDALRRRAIVITRTSTFQELYQPHYVAHQPSSLLRLNRPGWWYTMRRRQVPWVNFEDSAVDFRGVLEDPVWEQIQEQLRQPRETS